MLSLLLSVAFVIWCYMTLWFLLSVILKRNDIADIAWGLGFCVIAIYLYSTQVTTTTFLLYAGLVLLWGVRLASHIAYRNSGKKEDARYQEWKKQWGNSLFWSSYIRVFMVQGFFMFLIALPLVFSLFIKTIAPWQVVTAVLIWLYGFIFESIGDYQLLQFKKNPANKGKIMSRGLWRYTRHPNYFGEITQWWALWLLTVGSELALWAMLSPLTITFLILGVSGIPLLEKRYSDNTDYQAYKQKTSAFFPLPPKA